MEALIKKVVVIGPESTGKSTLAQSLAEHFKTVWCKEYAREYLLEHGTDYSFNDLLLIAKGQLALEDAAAQSVIINCMEGLAKDRVASEQERSNLLFIDTDMYVMKVWCEFVFKDCHAFIEEQIKQRKYDLYLLCNIDLPWVADELREYPDEQPRIELFGIYKSLLEQQSTPWVLISGDYEERRLAAIKAVEGLVG